MDGNQSLLSDRLAELYQKYTEDYCQSISLSLGYREARELISLFQPHYFSNQIVHFFELICSLSKGLGQRHVDLISAVQDCLFESATIEDTMFYLDLLLQLKTNGGIQGSLSDEVIDRIKSMLNCDANVASINLLAGKRGRGKSSRTNEENKNLFLSLIRYLLYLSLLLRDGKFDAESEKYCNNLNIILEYARTTSLVEENLKAKLYAKYISCINLILVKYSSDPDTKKLESIEAVFNHFNILLHAVSSDSKYFVDEEVCETWIEFMYLTKLLDESDRNSRFLSKYMIKAIINGKDRIKSAFIKLFESSKIGLLKVFMKEALSISGSDKRFIDQVCRKAVEKVHCMTRIDITKLLQDVPDLLNLSNYNFLPYYSFDLLIISYKRSLQIESINRLAQEVNNRLDIEMMQMGAESLCLAGNYFAVVPNQNGIKHLAKKWIERSIHTEVIDEQKHQNELVYFYIIMLSIEYSPEDPNDIVALKNELLSLKGRTVKILDKYSVDNRDDLVLLVSQINMVTSQACQKLESVQYIIEEDFSQCKDLFRNFSNFLQEIIRKLETNPYINTDLLSDSVMSFDTLIHGYRQFVQDFGIQTQLTAYHEFCSTCTADEDSKPCCFVDTNTPYTPEAAYKFFSTAMFLNSMIALFKYLESFAKSEEPNKNKIIESLSAWSYDLNSIADSNLFRWLSSQINQPAKAYIIQQIFYCATNDKPFTNILSASIKFYFVEPTLAVSFDPTLSYVLNTHIQHIVSNIVNQPGEGHSYTSLKDRVFYAPLDPSTDGETIYGGYILLNNKYRSKNPIIQASAKIVLVHELAHLLQRLRNAEYNFMKKTPTKSTKIQAPGNAPPTQKDQTEIGDYLETELFGFSVQYINESTIEFLNKRESWVWSQMEFKARFTETMKKNNESKKFLTRFRHQDRMQIRNHHNCVIRYGDFGTEEHKDAPQKN